MPIASFTDDYSTSTIPETAIHTVSLIGVLSFHALITTEPSDTVAAPDKFFISQTNQTERYTFLAIFFVHRQCCHSIGKSEVPIIGIWNIFCHDR